MVPQAIWADPGEFRGHVGALGPGAGGLPTPALPDTDSRREQMPDAKGLVGVSVCALWCGGGLGRSRGCSPAWGSVCSGREEAVAWGSWRQQWVRRKRSLFQKAECSELGGSQGQGVLAAVCPGLDGLQASAKAWLGVPCGSGQSQSGGSAGTDPPCSSGTWS